MGKPAEKKKKVYQFGSFPRGVNLNDPAISLKNTEVSYALNAVFEKKGIRRWCGCENLTEKDACSDYLRGLFHHQELSGTQHLFVAFGEKFYEIDKTTGAVTELYNPTGTGEVWGGSHWGKFYASNGTAVFKIEGNTAYRVGIAAPTSGNSAAAAGGTLPDGVYKIYLGYARKVSGLNVLYSKGYAVADVTLGAGNNTVSITGFANSSDAQVNNKVIWMTDAGGTFYYFYYETDNNTSTSFTIGSDSAKENAIDYEKDANPSGLPPAFTFMGIFDNRIFGIIGNCLYYSLKDQTGYNIERFPTNNKIYYPYQLTGWFGIGTTIYLNTADNGVIIQNIDDLGSRYSHIEKRVSFRYMRTVVDWNGGKFGLTKDGLQFFDGQKFIDFDYSINIRPVIRSMYVSADSNFSPCAISINRDNRLEYHLSFCNTQVGSTNNNRVYVLDLSQTYYNHNRDFNTPWEIIDRGFNYACADSNGTAYFGQSFNMSSTVYKELSTHTTQKGIYSGAGEYLTEATNMTLTVTSGIFFEDLFTILIPEEQRFLFQLNTTARLSIICIDDLSMELNQDSDLSSYGQTNWDEFLWDESNWSIENLQVFIGRGKEGTYGYTFYWVFSQTADDPDFNLSEIDILATLETGNQI